MNNSSKEKIGIRGIGLPRPGWAKSTPSKAERHAEPDKPAGGSNSREAPDPEVTEKTVRRKFSVDYKAQIVREADGSTEPGQIGALLRREGLYSSQLAQWRRAYQKGALAGLRDNKRGRKQTRHPLEAENERLKKENARLEQRLEQAQVIIDVQKKLSGIMRIPLGSEESKGQD